VAGSFSDFLEAELLDHIFNADYAAPANLYIALFTVAPDDTGGGTEASGTGYAREAVARGGWTRSGNAISNTAAIDFGTAGGSWGTVVAFAAFDAASGGNMLFWGDLTVSKTISNGDPVRFPAGDCDIALD
jgi:hypothetical protein